MAQSSGSDSHFRKLVAPTVITILCLNAFLGWIAALIALTVLGVPIPLWLRIAISVFVLALAAVSVWMLIERIQEVRSGEEDDLSQY